MLDHFAGARELLALITDTSLEHEPILVSAAAEALARCDRVALAETGGAPADELRRAFATVQAEVAVLKGMLGRLTAAAAAESASAAPPDPGGSSGSA